MWTGRATEAGSTAIICTTTTKTVACPYCSSERAWESASWHSVSAITGAVITQVDLGTAGKAIGCIGRRRLVDHGHRSGRIRRRAPIRRRGRDLPRARDRRWIDHRPAGPRLRAMGMDPRVPEMTTARLRAMGAVLHVPATSSARRLRVMEDGRRDRTRSRRRTKKNPASLGQIALAGGSRPANVKLVRGKEFSGPQSCAASLPPVPPHIREKPQRGIAYDPQ
jgi:hypothetical protein